jgi:hypothetical protein
MNIFYSILMIYALAFVIGMAVAGIIWFVFNILNYKGLDNFKSREHYIDMRRLRLRKAK